jgi:hypothetical protein
MSDNEMRIVIAEKRFPNHRLVKGTGIWRGQWILIPKHFPDDPYEVSGEFGLEQVLELPPLDLNAMREAWDSLSIEHKTAFGINLVAVVKRDWMIGELDSDWEFLTDNIRLTFIANATARQRAEAFIKTVCPEKWKGNE